MLRTRTELLYWSLLVMGGVVWGWLAWGWVTKAGLACFALLAPVTAPYRLGYRLLYWTIATFL
jgi:hypothetical protein